LRQGYGSATVTHMKKIVGFTLAALLLAGCTSQIPSDRYIYRRACRALKDAESVPEGAVPVPIEQARVSVGKNAAWVELPYTCAGAAGGTAGGVQIIRFKRVARTWTVERTFPRPEPGKPEDQR